MAAPSRNPDGLLDRVGRCLVRHGVAGRCVCAAFSGGLDSTVLLDLLARLRDGIPFELRALHVHHGLSPNADGWAESCAAFAQSRGVALRIERVEIDCGSPSGVEAAARAARYGALRRTGADFVALAHHRDDQAETVLLQALRGTGIKGLAAMGESRPTGAGAWLRPLLDEPREALLDHAREAGLAWVDDESNDRTAFDRNFLRHEVIPLLARRFPQYRESLARLARHAAVAEKIIDDLASEDAARLADGEGLSAGGLATLLPARQANVLRHFLARHDLPMPAQARLDEMVRQLIAASGDARILLPHGGRALLRHRGKIVVGQCPRSCARWRIAWHGEPVLSLGEDRGQARFTETAGEGIALDCIARGDWHFAPRIGGERIRLRSGGPTRTLKNLLREQAVPVWQRPRLPLLFDGEQMVWVPGVGIAADYRASDSGVGLAPQWHPVLPPRR